MRETIEKLLESYKGSTATEVCRSQDGVAFLRKNLDLAITKNAEDPDLYEFVGSDETVDREGDIIGVNGWQLGHFKKNPVILWGHDYRSPPIGRAVKVSKEDGKLKFGVKFADKEYPLADTVRRLVDGGFLRATSVGFIPHAWEDIQPDSEDAKKGEDATGRKPRRKFTKQELLELSIVTVPANPNALALAVQRGIVTEDEVRKFSERTREAVVPVELQERKVVPFKSYPLAPESSGWNGPREIAAATAEDLKLTATWYDEESPDAKSSYKLPHHRTRDKATVFRGVAAAMGALLGARGGVDIPADDRRGVYNHLAKHYREFDKEPPEFRQYEPEELSVLARKGLILAEDDSPILCEIQENAQVFLSELKEVRVELRKLVEAEEKRGGVGVPGSEDQTGKASGASQYAALFADLKARIDGARSAVEQAKTKGV